MKIFITKIGTDFDVEIRPDYGRFEPEVHQLFGGKDPNDAYTDSAFDESTIRLAAARWAEEWVIENHRNDTITEIIFCQDSGETE